MVKDVTMLPTVSCTVYLCISTYYRAVCGPAYDVCSLLVHQPGIEPGAPVWQTSILLLNHRYQSSYSPVHKFISTSHSFKTRGISELKASNVPFVVLQKMFVLFPFPLSFLRFRSFLFISLRVTIVICIITVVLNL